jgi:hypothetical protein
MALLRTRAWKNGHVVRVRFLDGDPTVQSRVRDVASEWTRYANLRFEFGDDPAAEIRVSFVQGGSWSWVGTEVSRIPHNEPTMNLGWLQPDDSDEEYARVTLHEFGHVLGCVHEHQSPASGVPWDRRAVYAFYAGPPNGWSEEEVDENVLDTYDRRRTVFTEFDPDSIMVYAIPPELTIGGYEVAWNSALSDRDKELIGQQYPFARDDVPLLEVSAAPTEARIAKAQGEDTYSFTVTEPGEHVLETTGTTNLGMSLSGPDDESRLVAEDDDNSGLGLNAKIEAGLMEGRYLVRVWRRSSAGSGRYAISVSRPRAR